jgi:Ca2+-binding EF-hand superfamily protein
VREVFSQLDVDRSGAVTRTEFERGLARLGVHFSQQDVAAIFSVGTLEYPSSTPRVPTR